MHEPELLHIAISFCKIHKALYGKEYWLGKKWIRGAHDPRTEQEFKEVQSFLHRHGMKGAVYRDNIAAYIKFAVFKLYEKKNLTRYAVENLLKEKQITPKFLIDDKLIRQYFLLDGEWQSILDTIELMTIYTGPPQPLTPEEIAAVALDGTKYRPVAEVESAGEIFEVRK